MVKITLFAIIYNMKFFIGRPKKTEWRYDRTTENPKRRNDNLAW